MAQPRADGPVWSALGRVGLLLGHCYARSRNVVPGGTSHTFYNWALVLWQVPNA